MLIPSKLVARFDSTIPWFVSACWLNFPARTTSGWALITSPAGYGKTTLISQWAAGKNDIGWYSLDEGDNQQERFASYLIAAVQQGNQRSLRDM